MLTVAFLMGKRGARRLGLVNGTAVEIALKRELKEEEKVLRRPRMFWFNAVLAIVVMGIMISGKVDPAPMFMVGVIFAMVFNYSQVDQQKS